MPHVVLETHTPLYRIVERTEPFVVEEEGTVWRMRDVFLNRDDTHGLAECLVVAAGGPGVLGPPLTRVGPGRRRPFDWSSGGRTQRCAAPGQSRRGRIFQPFLGPAPQAMRCVRWCRAGNPRVRSVLGLPLRNEERVCGALRDLVGGSAGPCP